MANSKKPSASRKLKGFTLVELIVVITILAILGTIGFLSIGGYSSKARDSARIGDIAQVSKSLDLSMVVSSSYPLPDGSFAVTYSGGAVWNQGTVWPLVMQYFKGTIAGGGLNEKPLDPLKNTEYGYSSLAEGKAYQLKAEYEGDLAQNAMGGGFLAGTAHAEAGNPTVAYVRGNFGGLTAKVSTGGMTFVLAVPGILTNSGGVAGASAPIGSLSGSLLFNGKPLRGASAFPPGAVVHSGAKTASNPSGLPASPADLGAMVAALQAAYSGSDIRSNQNIATLMNASSGSFATFGTSLVSAQLGGTPGGGGGSDTNTLVSGLCTWLPVKAIFFNSTSNYSLSSAAIGTSLIAISAGYSANPIVNTCQWKCETGYWYIGGVCTERYLVDGWLKYALVPNDWSIVFDANNNGDQIYTYCKNHWFNNRVWNPNGWACPSAYTVGSCLNSQSWNYSIQNNTQAIEALPASMYILSSAMPTWNVGGNNNANAVWMVITDGTTVSDATKYSLSPTVFRNGMKYYCWYQYWNPYCGSMINNTTHIACAVASGF